jgi:hypothetical protein
MNMPAFEGKMVHQVTLEMLGVNSIQELCKLMNRDEFITGTQWYHRKMPTGEIFWQDRGELVVNTAHIGKVAEFIEQEEQGYDESQGRTQFSRQYTAGPRGPIRPGRFTV